MRRLANRLDLAAPPTLDTLLGLPGVVIDPIAQAAPPEAVFACLRQLLAKALGLAVRSREREGRALLRDLRARRRALVRHCSKVRKRAPSVVADYRRRLAKRLADLMQETPQGFAGDGLAREVAMFAERADVTEELTRLEAHLAELDRVLVAGGSIGRNVDFLLQELNREVNTIGSKANDAAIAHEVVAMKGELEKMREQAQNLE